MHWNQMRFAVAFTAAAVVICTSGCGFLSLGRPRLASKDPAQKIPAMKAAAEGHDRSAVPLLIQALSSQDPAIRFYAIYALRKITGHDFGYVYYSPAALRRQAIVRWQQWQHRQNGPNPSLPAASLKQHGPNQRSAT